MPQRRSQVKNGKNHTLKQKKAIDAAGFEVADWLVYKAESHRLHIVHRISGRTAIILP
ncbi:DUF6906 family protein [Paenibacillus azoreducens]|uniref:DUF6906 family protein n=1 Tax=Paenibacillus azoreducens TaxID=116718 RepID=UPI0039F45831